MELITWIVFFLFVLLLSFLIYNTLLNSAAQDKSFDEERARRKIMTHSKDHMKISSEKLKDKKIKKQQKKLNKEKKIDCEMEEPTTEADSAPSSEVEQNNDTNKKGKPTKITGTTSNEKIEPKKNPKQEVKVKKEIANIILESDAAVEPIKEEKNKKIKNQDKLQNKDGKQTKKKVDSSQDVKITENVKTNELDGIESPSIVKTEVKEISAVPYNVKPANLNIKNTKKKKLDHNYIQNLKNDNEAVNINLLVSLIQKAELSRTENQLLIDALLNKQHEDISEWLKGPQDPLVKLKKQLSEKEEALKEEKQAALGLQAKLKELRAEINADKANYRQLEEKLANALSDCKSYSVKLQQSIEDNQTITSKLQQVQKQLNEDQLSLTKLKEERAEAEKQYHEAVRTLKSQIADYAVTCQGFENELTNSRNQITLIQEQSYLVNEELIKGKGNLEQLLEEAQFQVNKLQDELTSASREIQENRLEIENLTTHFNSSELDKQKLIEQNEVYSSQIKSMFNEIQTLREHNDSLNKKCSENWENGYTYNNKQGLAEYNARLEENEKTLVSLRNELDAKANIIDELNSSILTGKNELSKKDILIQKANAEIELLQKKLSEPQAKVLSDETLQLKGTLAEKVKEIEQIKLEVENYKQRNNELRNKNWKVVEALKKAEEMSQQNKKQNDNTRCDAMHNNDIDSKIKPCIKRIVKLVYPEISIEDKANVDIDYWLKSIEDVVSAKHSNSVHSNDCAHSLELQNQNNQLQTLVVHYQKVITETEGMLNQLQSNVEIEESKWKDKISTLEAELDHLRHCQTK